MSFINDFKASAVEVAGKTADKTQELISRGKMHVQIVKLRSELRRCYTYIGMRVYHKIKAGEPVEESFNIKINEIDILRSRLADLKDQADLVRYCKKCKNCGSYNDKEDELCLNCGANLHSYHKKVYSVKFSDDSAGTDD